jgi:hypothetical protein
MSAVTSVSETREDSPWWEILMIMAASLAISLLVPSLQIVAILIPVAYLIVERHLRKRTWSESGSNIRAFPQDLRHNVGWVAWAAHFLADVCGMVFMLALAR